MILRILSELITPFGLKLNSFKTKENKNIISSSVKPDKLHWFQLDSDIALQKRFLLLHQHSLIYPNSGSVVRGLSELNKKIPDEEDSIQIISIVADIMLHNPKAIPVCCSIISKVLKNTKENRRPISDKIHQRLMGTSKSEYAQIWLQRMLKDRIKEIDFSESLCKLVKEESGVELWNSSWLSNKKLKAIIDPVRIFDKKLFLEMDEVIRDNEVNIFTHSL